MNFKNWFEEDMSTQTTNNTEKASQIIQKSPKFAKRQGAWMTKNAGSNDMNKAVLGDVSWAMKNIVPKHIAAQTDVGKLGYQVSQDAPVDGIKFPKPKSMMKKA